ncbi:hypothetical protein CK203_052792 [Vitis vinifera]|uniref:Uncharacterized protein n=1 Tax=Vitis vinifera TaxID=29760 RepID=A0A438GUW0_VITVI|nr:hypothetical protein CK203_052792 [Vitis vinifera]
MQAVVEECGNADDRVSTSEAAKQSASPDAWTRYNSGVNNSGDLETRHGDMGLIAWDVLLPSGAIIPRYFKHHDPQWFYLISRSRLWVFFRVLLLSSQEGHSTMDWSFIAFPNSRFTEPLGSLVFFLGILQVMALIPKAGQDIQTAQVLELVTSLGRETCSHLGKL